MSTLFWHRKVKLKWIFPFLPSNCGEFVLELFFISIFPSPIFLSMKWQPSTTTRAERVDENLIFTFHQIRACIIKWKKNLNSQSVSSSPQRRRGSLALERCRHCCCVICEIWMLRCDVADDYLAALWQFFTDLSFSSLLSSLPGCHAILMMSFGHCWLESGKCIVLACSSPVGGEVQSLLLFVHSGQWSLLHVCRENSTNSNLIFF